MGTDGVAHARQLTERYASAAVEPLGALLVSCLGRGRYLYGQTGVETAVFADALGRQDVCKAKSGGPQDMMTQGIPMAGFFAGGEIGPVGYRSYTHSYTSSLAVFRPRSRNR